MKTLVLKYDYGYDVFAFDEAREEIMTYPNLTIFLNKMCGQHFENYEVRTLYGCDLMAEDKEYDAYYRLRGIIPDETPQAFEDLLTCYNSDFAYNGVEVD